MEVTDTTAGRARRTLSLWTRGGRTARRGGRRLARPVAVLLTAGLLGAGVTAPASAAPALGLTLTPIGSTVLSGDTTTFQIAWSCSSTSESCDAGMISVPVPTLQPDTSVQTVYVQGTPSTDGASGAPTVTGGVITWPMLASLSAGSSGQMTFTVKVPNISSPNGDTIEPVATFTASGVTQTATATKTVVSDTDLVTDKRMMSATTPGLDVPVTYQIATMHRTSINPSTGRFGGEPAKGTWGVTDVVTVDHLPTGAEFVSATGGGVYDAATHTVSWPAWSDNGATGNFTIAPDYQLTIRYPSTVFSTASTATNTATASAHPYLRPDQEVTSSDEVSHGFAAGSARGAVSKNGSLARPNGGIRGGGTAWQIGLSNLGTVPLSVDVTDRLPCIWSSPRDGNTDCSTPAIRNVTLRLTGGTAGTPYTIDYVTNLGSTGSTTLTAGPANVLLPSQSTAEWVTSVRIRATIPGGDVASIEVSGVVSPDLPQDSTGATYRNPNVPVGADVYLENCLAGTLTNANTQAVVQEFTDVCGYVRIPPDRPVVRVGKTMTDNVQGPEGQMGVGLTLSTSASNARWSPVLTDLVPEDLRFVPGSFTTAGLTTAAKAVLTDENLLLEVIEDYNGSGRQLVRVSWPGTSGLAPNGAYGTVRFAVQVRPGAEVGQRLNELAVFDTQFASIGCVVNTAKVDTGALVDGSGRTGCATTASYTVVASPSIGGTKWVKGSLDEDFLSSPSVGLVLAGQTAEYRLDVENTGNVAVNGVVAYEILPHVGDSGVGPASSDDRGSQWQTILAGAVTSDVPAEISYSASTNPCRGEVMSEGGSRADAPAGCIDDWTTVLPDDPSQVRAVRIDFGTTEFAAEQVHSVTVPVSAPSDADGVAWNSFAVAADEASTGDAVLPVEPNKVGLRAQSSLSVDKSVAQTSVKPSGEVVWTITVSNDGAGRTGGIVVVDRLPDALEYVSSTSTNGTYDPQTQGWTLAEDLLAGASATLELTTKVRADAELGELCNIAEAYLPEVVDTPISEDTACTTIVEEPKLPVISVVKSSDPVSGSSVQAGQDVVYTLTFSNTGEAAGPVDHTDDLADVLDDADLTVAPASSDPALTVTDGSTGAVQITGTLEAGQVVTVSYTATVKPDGARGNNRLANVVAPTGTDTPTCEDPGVSCTEHPVGELLTSKSVDPATGSTLRAGQVATYTLTFENTGQAPVTVDRDDVLDRVLDDADITGQPFATDGLLTVTPVTDGRFSVDGVLEAGQVETVTYQVTVKPDGQRGDDRLDNFLVPGDQQPPGGPCTPGGEVDCTVNHVSDVVVEKTSNPASGSTVKPGDVVTYTVTFTNVSTDPDATAAAVDYTDHMVDVLDDATLSSDPTAGEGLTAEVDGDLIHITGSLTAGQVSTVTYQVTVKSDAALGDAHLGNVVVRTGDTPVCAEGSTLCTDHPITETPDTPTKADRPLAHTGAAVMTSIAAALLLLSLGGGLLVARRRRATTH